MQRSRSTYRKRGGGGDSSDSSDDDDKGKKALPTRKRTVRKTNTGDKEGGDDVTAPTASAPKNAKKKNAITAMWKKDSDSDHEWENNLDDFLSKKSTVSNLADMIPTENWDLFKDRVRLFRKAGAKADEKKAQGPKASEYAPAFFFLSFFLACLPSLRMPTEDNLVFSF